MTSTPAYDLTCEAARQLRDTLREPEPNIARMEKLHAALKLAMAAVKEEVETCDLEGLTRIAKDTELLGDLAEIRLRAARHLWPAAYGGRVMPRKSDKTIAALLAAAKAHKRGTLLLKNFLEPTQEELDMHCGGKEIVAKIRELYAREYKTGEYGDGEAYEDLTHVWMHYVDDRHDPNVLLRKLICLIETMREATQNDLDQMDDD